MRAIIPAKASSTRVPNKNWREFYKGLSLVDINIMALLDAGLDAGDIYVSCEEFEPMDAVKSRFGVNPVLRDEWLCYNETSISDFIRGTRDLVGWGGDIIWSQVCDPLFTQHREVIQAWQDKGPEIDSICVVHPVRQYLLDPQFHPIGWGFGSGHVPSQLLPTLYQMPFTMSILTRQCIREVGYHVGERPLWYASEGHHIDIDTEQDFRAAQALYRQTN